MLPWAANFILFCFWRWLQNQTCKNTGLRNTNSMLRNTSIADQHSPLQHSFSGQVSLRLQRFSLHWVLAEKITLLIIFCKKNIDEYLFIWISLVQQSRLLDFFSRAQLCSFSFSSSHPQQVNRRDRPMVEKTFSEKQKRFANYDFTIFFYPLPT